MPAISMTVNGKAVQANVEAAHAAGAAASREQLQPDRHACRLRHQPVRRLHRASSNGTRGEVLHDAGGAGATAPSITTIEGLADRRRTAPDAGSLPRAPRPAVRLLHAGHGDDARSTW